LDELIGRLDEVRTLADASARQNEEFYRRLAEFERNFRGAGAE
jgi:hypothetical protein